MANLSGNKQKLNTTTMGRETLTGFPKKHGHKASLAISSNSSSSWKNEYNVVHVVQTRFMQYQPSLQNLGLARLELFRSITLPSMMQQTNQDFLWIMRTDPNLTAAVKEPLIETVKRALQQERDLLLVLVASNTNNEGFRNAACVTDISEESVWAGEYAWVVDYHAAAQRHVVLETRLDADDALFLDFVEGIQRSAARRLFAESSSENLSVTTSKHTATSSSSLSSSSSSSSWMLWCIDNHVEWQHYSPWQQQQQDPLLREHADDGTGALILARAGFCITPGLTWGYQLNSKRSDIPTSKHHELHKQIPTCETSNPVSSNCLLRVGEGSVALPFPLALRARTPTTSAGMGNVVLPPGVGDSTSLWQKMPRTRLSKLQAIQSQLWQNISPLFGMEIPQLLEARSYLEDHFVLIVKDAVAGQCTKGHSCKHVSREALAHLLVAKHYYRRRHHHSDDSTAETNTGSSSVAITSLEQNSVEET